MDDVLAVMDAAGSEQAAFCRHARGRADGGAVRGDLPRAHQRPGPLRHLRPRHLGAGLRVGLARRAARRAHGRSCSAHWGEGWVAGSVAPSQQSDPNFMEWAGRLERLAASPSTVRRIFDLIGEIDVRDVLPSIRVPTLVMHRTRGHLPQGGALALHRVEDPRRALRGARGRRQPVLDRRLGRPAGRDRGVPHRHAPRARARPDAGDRDVHRHLRLHQARRRDGRPRLALPARAPRRAVPAGARAPSRPGGEAHGRRLPRHLRRARRGRSAAPRRWRRPWARSGWRCAPACTRASSR